ncbi:MAG: hypothetical protein GKS00_01465 [Alphaproteobacteria bacterium]|nr:hypothetical protein [Alphaproteobacteria bacterium]
MIHSEFFEPIVTESAKTAICGGATHGPHAMRESFFSEAARPLSLALITTG